MERALVRQLVIVHVAIALVVLLGTATAVLALRSSVERTGAVATIDAHIRDLADIQRDTRDVARAGRRYMLEGDSAARHDVDTLGSELRRAAQRMREQWPTVADSVEQLAATVSSGVAHDRSDVVGALVQYEDELRRARAVLTEAVDGAVAREIAVRTSHQRAARLARGAQILLVIAALTALMLLALVLRSVRRALRDSAVGRTPESVLDGSATSLAAAPAEPSMLR